MNSQATTSCIMRRTKGAQRRQPVSYAELQEVQRTGVFPLMTDPVRPGAKPYCYNCTHWQQRTEWQGTCHNKAAREHAPLAKIERINGSGILSYTTGGLCHCPLHEMKTTQ